MLSWRIADNNREALEMGFKQLVELALIAHPNHGGVQKYGKLALANFQ